jgi:hypothetical protein
LDHPACSEVAVLTSLSQLSYVEAVPIILAFIVFIILVTANHCSLFTQKFETELYSNILEQHNHRMWLNFGSHSYVVSEIYLVFDCNIKYHIIRVLTHRFIVQCEEFKRKVGIFLFVELLYVTRMDFDAFREQIEVH